MIITHTGSVTNTVYWIRNQGRGTQQQSILDLMGRSGNEIQVVKRQEGSETEKQGRQNASKRVDIGVGRT